MKRSLRISLSWQQRLCCVRLIQSVENSLVFDKVLKKIGRSCAGSTVKGSFLDLKILQDILQDMLGSFKFFLKTLIMV